MSNYQPPPSYEQSFNINTPYPPNPSYQPNPPYPTNAGPIGSGYHSSGGSAPYPPGQPSFMPYPQSDHQPKNDDERPFTNRSYDDRSLRQSFIKKVYLIMTVQLLITAVFISVFLFTPRVQKWVQNNSWVYYISYATFFCTYIALVCCSGVRRKFPGNFIALTIFTVSLSYMVATISSFYNVRSVLVAVGITCAVCVTISMFAAYTKIDFTKCGALLMVLSFVFILTGIICMIVYSVNREASPVLQVVYGGIGALLFSLYLIYDTQMLMGKFGNELSEEEYIYGALQLYMDVVNLFLIILQLTGSRD